MQWCFDGLGWQIYAKAWFESTKLIKSKDYAKLAFDQEYVVIVSNIR